MISIQATDTKMRVPENEPCTDVIGFPVTMLKVGVRGWQ